MANEPVKKTLGSNLPSVQYPLIMNVLQSMAEGETELQACKQWGVSVTSFRYKLKEDEELRELYAEAVKIGNDALADMLINIDQVHSAPAMAGVISKNIQWLLERRNPDKYGARVTVTSENRASMALIAALDKAIDRIPAATAPTVLLSASVTDVEYEPVSPLPPDKGKPAPHEEVPAERLGSHKEETKEAQQRELLRTMGLLD